MHRLASLHKIACDRAGTVALRSLRPVESELAFPVLQNYTLAVSLVLPGLRTVAVFG